MDSILKIRLTLPQRTTKALPVMLLFNKVVPGPEGNQVSIIGRCRYSWGHTISSKKEYQASTIINQINHKIGWHMSFKKKNYKYFHGYENNIGGGVDCQDSLRSWRHNSSFAPGTGNSCFATGKQWHRLCSKVNWRDEFIFKMWSTRQISVFCPCKR